jgi:hypothetical protein
MMIHRWIIILQEFDLEFVSAKYKKYLVFVELISERPIESGSNFPEYSLINEDLFLIASYDPWYGDILMYLQNLKCPSSASHDEHRQICHQTQKYLIINDPLCHRGVDYILHHCLTHKEAYLVLNDCHTRPCGGHLSQLETTPKNSLCWILLSLINQRLYRIS